MTVRARPVRGYFRMRSVDRGLARLIRQLSGRVVRRLAVGVLRGRGDAANRGGSSSVLGVAIAHEFGTDRVPARSFVRAWADETHDTNLERVRQLARDILSGRRTEEAGLRALGREMVGEIRDRMRAGIDPPLSPATAARKGTSTPLVGGQLERALSYQVRGAR